MAALDGTINGEISFQNWGDSYLLDIQSELRKVNIKKLFSQFNNFYQNENGICTLLRLGFTLLSPSACSSQHLEVTCSATLILSHEP